MVVDVNALAMAAPSVSPSACPSNTAFRFRLCQIDLPVHPVGSIRNGANRAGRRSHGGSSGYISGYAGGHTGGCIFRCIPLESLLPKRLRAYLDSLLTAVLPVVDNGFSANSSMNGMLLAVTAPALYPG